ncbi:MAG TPA: PfkB family carbohydrate kinase [Armatimonadota bacterium]|nr:PfkB family carbohydrate kinase [Armatimonadota bacterium]
MCVTETGATHLPIQPQQGPIDICGAGDSVMAGCALALCAGARPEEAALIGNLAASLTIQQIGVTGTTSREAIRERFAASGAFFQPQPLPSFSS